MAELKSPTTLPAGSPEATKPGPSATSKMTGRQKAAIMLVTLGPERAAQLFGHMRDDEIEALTLEMAKLRNLNQDVTDAVLEEAIETSSAMSYIGSGGFEYARDVLEKSLGEARAAEIMGRLSAVIEARPFEFLRRTPPEQIVAFLRPEAPQTMALTIANLHTQLAAEVLAQLPPEKQSEVALRIATMNETSPDVIKEVEAVMRQKLANVISQEYSAAGGVDSLVDILNRADRGTERNVLDRLAEADADLAEEIRMMLFVFEDIVKLDDRSVQILLKEVDQKDLALALRGVSEEVRDKVVGNMSQRAAEMLLEEIEYQPPQLRRVVEEAQGRIVVKVRQLEEAEAIVIGRGDGEDELVA
ncbi:MAG: flagellar motor switch protein FliG [Thermoleophilaceae bacterium]|jgi:flagellar motor switch protein FliG|nr:flagellar motor switch protein FliG [Thermoleophilaceae bacterium]